MIRWRFEAGGDALKTVVGRREHGLIRAEAASGCALHGPYLDMPAGEVTARVILAGEARGRVKMDLCAGIGGDVLAERTFDLAGAGTVPELSATLPGPISGFEVRLFCAGRTVAAIAAVEIDLERGHAWRPLDPDRPVGFESGKSYADKIASGFFDRYLSGAAVLEVGYKGYDHATVPIVPQAIGVDIGYPGYDGTRFPFADESFDAIYSSHCFEHVGPYVEVLRDWHRILKVGGFLVIVVPHQHLFERKRDRPSRWNGDHKRFYTPRSLLGEIEEALAENSYRIRHLIENDRGFDYGRLPREGGTGCYEIELVIEKIAQPAWTLDDGTVRTYPPNDFWFRFGCERPSPWEIRLDLSRAGECVVWGPYHALAPGRYEAEFRFDLDGGATMPEVIIDVGCEGETVAFATLSPEPVGPGGVRIVLPFVKERADDLVEYRIYAPLAGSATRPAFRGVDVRYAPAGG